VIHPLNY